MTGKELQPRTVRRRNELSRPWPKDEVARLVHMRDVLHMSFQDIGRDFGRSIAACESKYNVFKKEWAPRHDSGWAGNSIKATPEAIADRDARYQLWLQQPAAAALMGDPLPGRSALDQRERGAQQS